MEEVAPPPPKKTSTGKIVLFAGCGCLSLIALVLAGIAVIFFSVFGAIKSSDAYSETLALVQAHPQATEALGAPITPGFWLTGSINFNNGEGAADLTIPVSGPKGSGTLRVIADKPGGSAAWNYTTRELRLEGDDGQIIPLAP